MIGLARCCPAGVAVCTVDLFEVNNRMRKAPNVTTMTRETEFEPADTSNSNNTNHGDSSHAHQYNSEIGVPSLPMEQESWEVPDARPLLPSAAFFMGDLRDGLPMVRIVVVVVAVAVVILFESC
jgi:hypothetical protein